LASTASIQPKAWISITHMGANHSQSPGIPGRASRVHLVFHNRTHHRIPKLVVQLSNRPFILDSQRGVDARWRLTCGMKARSIGPSSLQTTALGGTTPDEKQKMEKSLSPNAGIEASQSSAVLLYVSCDPERNRRAAQRIGHCRHDLRSASTDIHARQRGEHVPCPIAPYEGIRSCSEKAMI
jgi:hypothetical protein